MFIFETIFNISMYFIYLFYLFGLVEVCRGILLLKKFECSKMYAKHFVQKIMIRIKFDFLNISATLLK